MKSRSNLGFPGGSVVKNLPANAGDTGLIPGSGMATHSSILVLEIPWTNKPGELQSMGLQRVGCDWARVCTHTHTHTHTQTYTVVTYKCESESDVAQSCPTLCDPMDCNLPGFSIHGIFQARVLECIAISFSRGSSRPRNRTWVSCIAGRCFTL